MSTWHVRETTLETQVINTSLNPMQCARTFIFNHQTPQPTVRNGQLCLVFQLSGPKKSQGKRRGLDPVGNKFWHWEIGQSLAQRKFTDILLRLSCSFVFCSTTFYPSGASHQVHVHGRIQVAVQIAHEDITLDWRHGACGRTIFLAAFISNLFPQREENNWSSLEWSSWIGMDKHLKHSETAYFESIIPH